MPPIRLADPQAPLSGRIGGSFAYPLRGAALTNLVALTLAHYLAFIPLIGFAFELIVWAITYLYALACLRHTAEGYADPPELSSESSADGWIIIGVLLLGMGATWAAKTVYGAAAAWLVSLTLALILPSIVMSLAYDEGWGTALNPATWLRSIRRFGLTYFLLVGVQLLVAYLLGPLQIATYAALPAVLASPMFYFVAIYATLFNFHLMGVLLYHHHERLGLQPEAPRLAAATGQNADRDLLDTAQQRAAKGDPDAGIEMLQERLHDRHAAPALHLGYRALLRAHGRNPELLAHAPRCLAALLGEDDETRALGVVTECVDIDSGFMPDDPAVAGRLADAAARRGMPRLALKLARGYPNTWPRAQAAPRYGLLAAQLLAGPLNQRMEAGVLAAKLLDAYPHSEQRPEIEALLQTLGMTGGKGQPA